MVKTKQIYSFVMFRINYIINITTAIAINIAFIAIFSLYSNSSADLTQKSVVKISLLSSKQKVENIQMKANISKKTADLSKKSLIKNNDVIQDANITKELILEKPFQENDNSYVAPKYIYGSSDNPAPKYPKIAIRNKYQGKVILCVNVNKDGSVSQVNICSSSGFHLLDNAALKTIKKWHFKAATKNNELITAKIRIPVIFALNS